MSFDSSRRRALRAGVSMASLLSAESMGYGRARSRTLVIGILAPLSGYLEGAGRACLQGMDLAKSILPRHLSTQFAVLPADTGDGPDSAVQAAERLIDAGVHMLVGCYDSAQTVAVAAQAELRRVPLIINIGAAPSITEQGYRYVFRNFPDARRIVLDSYELQRELFHRTGFVPKRAALLYINNGRGIELIKDLLPSMNMPYQITASVSYDPKSSDLAAPVKQAQDAGAELLWTVSRNEDAIRLGMELVNQKWTPGALISSNAGLQEPAYLQALGKNAEYAVTVAPYYDPNKPLARQLRAAQRRRFPGAPLSTLQTYTFEALLIAASAYSRAQTFDRDALASALRATDIPDNVTPGPGVSFDAKGQNASLRLVAIQNLEGVGKVVAPAASAEADPRLPMPAWESRS